MQMGNILKKGPIHKQIVATAKRLRYEDYDLAESYAWALKKRKFLLERILDNYEMPKYSTTTRITGNFQCKVNGNKTKHDSLIKLKKKKTWHVSFIIKINKHLNTNLSVLAIYPFQ